MGCENAEEGALLEMRGIVELQEFYVGKKDYIANAHKNIRSFL